MTLTQINYFLELCRTMNFTKAAQNLYITQPTLSRQIKLLETELQIELVKRNNKEVVLTQAGEIFRDGFIRISGDIDLTLEMVKKTGRLQREINVGFAESVTPNQVIRFVRELQESIPDLNIKMKQRYYHELKHEFDKGAIDIAVSIEKTDFENWKNEWKTIYELPAYFIYSPKLFPDTESPCIDDFRTKKLILSAKEGSDNLINRQKEILHSIGIDINEDNSIYADDITSSLMFSYCSECYSVFYNPVEIDMLTMPLPEHAEKFRMVVNWNNDTVPFLTHFFCSL